MKSPIYIASCSFGKDSIATILLALENGEPLDRVVFAEVMFDHERGISGEIPEHIEWVYSTAIPKLEAMGVKVDVVRAERDYVYFFANMVGGTGRWQGKIYGFPIAGMCFINRDCKVRVIKRYLKQFEDVIQYIGIAKDEPNRLGRLDGIKKISLLDKYNYTEAMARAKCEEYGLLSPIYQTGTRNGCWFCPNASIKQFGRFRKAHPDLWAELVELSHTPNLCSYGFKYGKTLQRVEREIDWNERQLKLF
jgi:3'-phosphoadenosine 5'-phosphosulfate sulfotransferase (PAPS reductase)/FAD synthetase